MFSSFFNWLFDNRFYYLSLIEDNGKWHIHGLWPQYDNYNYPSFCNRTIDFDIKKIETLLDKLNKEWYSDKGKNEEFWKHEWLKHGTCMFNTCNEYDYFKKALDLFENSKKNNTIDKYRIPNTNKSMIPFTLDFCIRT